MSSKIVDVRREGVEIQNGVFLLRRFLPETTYMDLVNSRKIGSIGRNMFDHKIYAAVDARYQDAKNYECLFTLT